jgi:hypothetical protein
VTGSQPVVLKRNKSGQEGWLESEEIYAVKPGVPSKDKKKLSTKESKRVDNKKLTATLVTTRGYIV